MTWHTSYYHYDGLGSTQLLTDENGNATDSYTYTAFGEPVATGAENPTLNPFRFVGQVGYYLDDDTGNSYVRARTYSSSLTRWLTEDPLGFTGDDAELYRYARNNPVIRIDPAGTISYIVKDNHEVFGSECGGPEYGVLYDFGFEHAKHCAGYIVQMNEQYCNTKLCNRYSPNDCPSSVAETNEYAAPPFWEFWYVEKDAPLTQHGLVGKLTGIRFSDVMTFSFIKETCGATTIRGEIRFFCKSDAIDLGTLENPKGGFAKTSKPYASGDCSHTSGYLPSTGTKPKFWDTPNVSDGEARDNRYLKLTWNCCDGATHQCGKAIAFPIFGKHE